MARDRRRNGELRSLVIRQAKHFYKHKDSPNDLNTSIESRDGSFCVHDILDELNKNGENTDLNALCIILKKECERPYHEALIVKLTGLSKSSCKSLDRSHAFYRFVPLGKKPPENARKDGAWLANNKQETRDLAVVIGEIEADKAKLREREEILKQKELELENARFSAAISAIDADQKAAEKGVTIKKKRTRSKCSTRYYKPNSFAQKVYLFIKKKNSLVCSHDIAKEFNCSIAAAAGALSHLKNVSELIEFVGLKSCELLCRGHYFYNVKNKLEVEDIVKSKAIVIEKPILDKTVRDKTKFRLSMATDAINLSAEITAETVVKILRMIVDGDGN